MWGSKAVHEGGRVVYDKLIERLESRGKAIYSDPVSVGMYEHLLGYWVGWYRKRKEDVIGVRGGGGYFPVSLQRHSGEDVIDIDLEAVRRSEKLRTLLAVALKRDVPGSRLSIYSNPTSLSLYLGYRTGGVVEEGRIRLVDLI
jgi:hypothetical protein